jgi:hypothetical protein
MRPCDTRRTGIATAKSGWRRVIAVLLLCGMTAFIPNTSLAAETRGAHAAAKPNTWIPALRLGDEHTFFEVYGQINKGFLFYDDGRSSEVYPLVDNESSSTRFGFKAEAPVTDHATFGVNFEFEWRAYSSTSVNRFNRTDPEVGYDTMRLRHYEGYLSTQDFGQIWVGQGSMASDGASEADLSGTHVIGYSKVQDQAGGQIFAFSNTPGFSSVTVNDAFDNLDGLSRLMRLRYDSPDFAGFSVGTSVGRLVVGEEWSDTQWDVAAKYADTIGDFQIKGAAAYSRPSSDEDRLNGSFSVLHHPSGINATIATGHASEPDASNPEFIYAKLGYKTHFFDLGMTAFSADIYDGHDFVNSGSHSWSYGFQAVQSLDYFRTDLFLGVRLYDYDDDVANYKNGLAVMTGARIKF